MHPGVQHEEGTLKQRGERQMHSLVLSSCGPWCKAMLTFRSKELQEGYRFSGCRWLQGNLQSHLYCSNASNIKFIIGVPAKLWGDPLHCHSFTGTISSLWLQEPWHKPALWPNCDRWERGELWNDLSTDVGSKCYRAIQESFTLSHNGSFRLITI